MSVGVDSMQAHRVVARVLRDFRFELFLALHQLFAERVQIGARIAQLREQIRFFFFDVMTAPSRS